MSSSPSGLVDFAAGLEYSPFPLSNRVVNILGIYLRESLTSKYTVLEEIIQIFGGGASENDSWASTLWLRHKLVSLAPWVYFICLSVLN